MTVDDSIREQAMQALAEAYGRARDSGRRNMDAMTLATLGADGAPSVRTVLARAIDADGICFYTDARSRKGRALAADARAAVCWYWEPIEEQASAEGVVERLDDATVDADFARRPPGGQALIAASEQSAPLASEDALRARVIAGTPGEGDPPVERPGHWIGFRLVPTRVELWQGRRDRVHRRTVYRETAQGWVAERLSP